MRTVSRPRAAGYPGLKLLARWWVALLTVTVACGEVVVHAGHSFVLTHVDLPVQRAVTPPDPTAHSWAGAITVLGDQAVTILGTLVLLLVLYRAQRPFALAAPVLYIGANSLTGIVKLVVHRSGPAHRLASGIRGYAFPSGHSTASAALFVGGALLLCAAWPWRRVRRALVLSVGLTMAVLVAGSRLILDVHWTSDVCAGFLVGTCWSLLVVRVWAHNVVAAATAPGSLGPATGAGNT